MFHDEEIADAPYHRSYRQPGCRQVHVGEDVESQHSHSPAACDDSSGKATHDGEVGDRLERIQQTLVEVGRDRKGSRSNDRTHQGPGEYRRDFRLIEAPFLGLTQHQPGTDDEPDPGHQTMEGKAQWAEFKDRDRGV